MRAEGASQTSRIMGAAAARRRYLGWTAERLAAEMAAVGIPWNAPIVVNLELGRRRSLRVHELLALAYVLEVPPLDLLVPLTAGAPPRPAGGYPVTPAVMVPAPVARAWIKGEAGSLRPGENDGTGGGGA